MQMKTIKKKRTIAESIALTGGRLRIDCCNLASPRLFIISTTLNRTSGKECVSQLAYVPIQYKWLNAMQIHTHCLQKIAPCASYVCDSGMIFDLAI